jgi:probable phosphoglycerate mutase
MGDSAEPADRCSASSIAMGTVVNEMSEQIGNDAPCTTRLLFVRHGESVATVQRRLAGSRTCEGLSTLGRRQARRLRDRLAAGWEEPIDALVSSPVCRAWETAEIVSPALGVAPIPDPAWEEHRPGDADGLRFEDIVARYGAGPDGAANGADPDQRWWPGAETMGEFRQRVIGALNDLTDDYAGGTSLVTCHGGVIDVVFRHLLGLPLDVTFDLWTSNTAITEFASRHLEGERPRRWQLVRYNDAAHLAGLPADSRRATVAA